MLLRTTFLIIITLHFTFLRTSHGFSPTQPKMLLSKSPFRQTLKLTIQQPQRTFLSSPPLFAKFPSSASPKKPSRKERLLLSNQSLNPSLISPVPITTDQYGTEFHTPVMVNECLSALFAHSSSSNSVHDNDDDVKMYVDCTLGGGGHSHAILERLNLLYPSTQTTNTTSTLIADTSTNNAKKKNKNKFILVGVDRDTDAISAASKRLQSYLDLQQFTTIHSTFSNLTLDKLHSSLPLLEVTATKDRKVDAILLDLGVSSFQIDESLRGFSFMRDGPLDMRMDSTKISSDSKGHFTAQTICNTYSHTSLSSLLQIHSDETPSRADRIAHSIIQSRPLTTTSDLTQAISNVVPEWDKRSRRNGRMPTLARAFQALRIRVNDEDGELLRFLTITAPSLLKKGGVLVVLAYHSSEDRVCKNIFKYNGLESGDRVVVKDMYGNVVDAVGGREKIWELVRDGGKNAELEEVGENRRSRSARLRVGRRV